MRAKRQGSRNWKVVYWCWSEPVRGKWKGLQIARRYTKGRLTPTQAWRYFNLIRVRQHIPRVELWAGRERRLVR